MDVPLISNATIHLAEQKGYPFAREKGFIVNPPSIYRVQQWLRHAHNIHVVVAPDMLYGHDGHKLIYNVRVIKGEFLHSYFYQSDLQSFQQALEKGLQEGIKLINLPED